MKRDEKVNCTITGPDGEVVFKGTTEDMKRTAFAIKEGALRPLLEGRQVKRNEKCTEYLKYQFTPEETAINAKDLARQNQALIELELKKKQLMTDLKAEFDKASMEVARLSRWVNDEYDFRQVPCVIKYNSPKTGRKLIVREDTGEIVRDDDMSAEEGQEILPLE